MKFSVDRIEEGIVILENIYTKEIIEAEIEAFSFEVKEGMIVVYDNEKFSLDLKEAEQRRESLRERLNNLKKSD